MSLQVWLPLNGSLENKGLSEVTVANNGAVVDDNGKIGKCYKFGTEASSIGLPSSTFSSLTGDFSVGCWVKINSWNTSYSTIWAATSTSASWINIVAGMLRDASTQRLLFCIGNDTSSTQASCETPANVTLGIWNHFCCTYTSGIIKLYQNGLLVKEYATTIVPKFSATNVVNIGKMRDNTYQSDCFVNDFRIYDHCLSDKEVKELSKGLVLHYKLDDINVQQLNNCYDYPTMDTSLQNAGWAHWSRTGASGNYGQNTDKSYIYNKNNTYSHWVSNASDATGEYLFYQSPPFDGGYRSLCAIIKSENGAAITEEICFPAWNARDGGAVNNVWTSIIPLEDNFYLCKCEGIHQDGSNDLVGMYVCPGCKVYFSEAYLENDREKCSDILQQYDSTVRDSSGYGNNGTITGFLTVVPDTPRYSASTYMTSSDIIKHTNCLDNSNQEWTCCAWVKSDSEYGYQQLNNFNIGNKVYHSAYPLLYLNDSSNDYYSYGDIAVPRNEWSHIVFVFKNSERLKDVYINGELHTSYGPASGVPRGIPDNVIIGSSYSGWLSDYREYATALSAEDIKELYETSSSIDKTGNLFARELTEV